MQTDREASFSRDVLLPLRIQPFPLLLSRNPYLKQRYSMIELALQYGRHATCIYVCSILHVLMETHRKQQLTHSYKNHMGFCPSTLCCSDGTVVLRCSFELAGFDSTIIG